MSRNITLRYRRSALGFGWALLNPLVTIVILVAVFGAIFRIGVRDYWAFLISGYFAWLFVVHTVTEGATTIRAHAHLVRNAAFPPEVLVLGTATSRLVELVAELAIVALIVGITRHDGFPGAFLFLPVLVSLLFVLTVALTLPIAAASVFFTDVQFALPVGLMLLGYLSPVYYPLSFVPEAWIPIVRLNPFVDLLTMFHDVLYDGRWPADGTILRAFLVIGAVHLIARATFRWKRDLFAEVV